MLVETLKKHSNIYGMTHEKEVGALYNHPAPQGLISMGWVKNADQNNRKGDGVQGDGKGTFPAKKHNGPERSKAGRKSRARTSKTSGDLKGR